MASPTTSSNGDRTSTNTASSSLRTLLSHCRRAVFAGFDRILLSNSDRASKLTPIDTTASLIDLFTNTYAPTQTMILSYLSVADVINLTLTCKGFNQVQPTLMTTAYNINRLLGKFFDDPLEFRSLQGQCGAIITGRHIRGWFDRSAEVPRTLMMYVAQEQSEQMIEYIKNKGYREQQQPRADRFLAIKRTVTGLELKVYMCKGDKMPIAQLLMNSNFTVDMCFITWNKAYAIFPYTAFIRRECYILKDISSVECDLNELSKDGFRVKTVSWAQQCDQVDLAGSYGLGTLLKLGKENDDIKELARNRRIGDKHTWSIELGTAGVEKPSIPDGVLESNTFQLFVDAPSSGEEGVESRYVLGYTDPRFQHPVLKYTYLGLEAPEPMTYYTARCDALDHRLNELTRIELSKIPPGDRPDEYLNLLWDLNKATELRGNFTLPDSWTFYDDEVIAELDKAWKIQENLDRKAEAARKAKFERLTSTTT